MDDEYVSWMKLGASAHFGQIYLREYDPQLNTSGQTDRIMKIEQKSEWLRLVVQYTGGTYSSGDMFVVWANSTEVVKLLFANVSIDDAWLVLSWNLIRQLLPLSSGRLMVKANDDDFRDTCFRAVLGIMEMAVMSSYIRRCYQMPAFGDFADYGQLLLVCPGFLAFAVVPPAVLSSATAMAVNLKAVLRDKLLSARWMEGWMQSKGINKASNMGLVVGYPKDAEIVAQKEAFYGEPSHWAFFVCSIKL
ncbi:hypothetical protein MRX96_020610 [Rhipicephalus microplus]